MLIVCPSVLSGARRGRPGRHGLLRGPWAKKLRGLLQSLQGSTTELRNQATDPRRGHSKKGTAAGNGNASVLMALRQVKLSDELGCPCSMYEGCGWLTRDDGGETPRLNSTRFGGACASATRAMPPNHGPIQTGSSWHMAEERDPGCAKRKIRPELEARLSRSRLQ
jgi:hypothetical protein